MSTVPTPNGETYLVSLGSCSFKRIYNDAAKLLDISHQAGCEDYVYQSCLPRTALLLFAISLEALANRILRDIEELGISHDIPERTPTAEKWKLIPKYHPHAMKREFDTSSCTWQSFVELIKWRDEYVHPKAIVPDVRRRGMGMSEGSWQSESVLTASEIPKHIRDRFPELRAPRCYGKSSIPTSPYDVVFSDAQVGKQIVDEMTQRLDEILDSRLTKTGLLKEQDQGFLCHPDGAIKEVDIARGLESRWLSEDPPRQ